MPLQTKILRSSGLAILIIITLYVGSGLAQPASIRTAEGYLFITNGKDMSYACEVRGKDIKPTTTADNPSFSVDGALIQMLSVAGHNFEPSGKAEIGKLLEIHRDWEVDYLNTLFGTPLSPRSEPIKIDGRDFLFWSFQRPKYTDQFDRDAYVTTLMGRDVFGINTPVKVGEDLPAARERLLNVMRTLKTSEKPYDIEAIAAAIKKGEKPPL